MAEERKIPAPLVNPESQRFWDACKERTLLICRDNSVGEHFFYPRNISPLSGSDDVDWVEASGEGTLYTHSTFRRAPVPYCLAYVTLAEGPTIMTNIVDSDFDTLECGQKVKLVWKDAEDGTPVPCFAIA